MRALRGSLLLLAFGAFIAWTPAIASLPGTSHPGPFEADTTDVETPADTTTSEKKEPWVVSSPHGPSETIAFTTEEGTWISVDVSPDGKHLVFDILGDLYRLPIAGGKAEPMTSGPAYDIQPRFSPDGSRILFTSDRGGSDNLWTATVDGSDLRPITSDSKHEINSGDWSPDGNYVVARKRITDRSSIGVVELWLYHVMGGSGVKVTDKGKIGDSNGPVFSPNGRWIYFAARPGRYAYNRNVYAGIWQIRAYDRETGNIRRHTGGYGGSGRPEISPDGKTLSFIRRDRERTLLMLHDIGTGQERVLFDGLDPDMQENFANTGTYPGYSWTPDGKSIVISYGGGIHRISVKDGTAARIPFSAEVNQEVVEALRFQQDIAPDNIRIRMISWPVVSPGGDDLVFSTLGRLYRMDLDGGEPVALTTQGPRAYAPSFAPNRNRLAYVSWSDREGGRVWVMDNYRGSRRVTDLPGQYANPVFSPDGQKLVFLRGTGVSARGNLEDELQLDIFWAPAGGGEPRYVVSIDNRGSARKMPRLGWSPDGERIYYNEDVGTGEKARTALASIRPDGTDRREHLRVRHAEEIVPSPDGQWVVFSRLHEGFLAALPHVGKEPVELSGDKGAVPAYRFSQEGADWLNWSADGSEVTWGFGPYFYRLSLADIQRGWDEEKAKAARKTEPGAENESGDKKEKDDPKFTARLDTLEVVLEVPRARPKGTFALRGARLITMNGTEVIPRGTLVVTDDRITDVGPEDAVSIPEGARVFDVSGKTIIPGLIDVHAHLHYDSMDIIPENVDSYYANLAYGVTTTHDPSASSYAVFTQSEMVEAGVMVGPRIFSTGFILYGADIANMAPIESLEDARHHIRRMKTLGAFTVKSYMQPRREQRQWVIEAARDEEVMVLPEGGGFLELNMGMVLDGHTGIEHALPVAPIYNDVVTLLARSGTGYTPTLLVAYGGLSGEHWFYQHTEVWKDQKLLRFLPRGPIDARSRRRPLMATDDDWHHIKVAEGCKKLVEAGGKVQLGAHGQLQGLGAHWELWGLGQGGMSNMDALRSATLSGAEYIGLDETIGSLESGKLADLVILDANPLDDLRNSNTVFRVVKNGEMYDGNDMSRIWPSSAPRPEFFWETQGRMLMDLNEPHSTGK